MNSSKTPKGYMTTTVQTTNLRAVCTQCHEAFETFGLPDILYGAKLLYTVDGQRAAFLACLGNPVCDEVSRMLNGPLRNMASDLGRTDLFDMAIGAACDPLDGVPLDATARQACPHCGSREVNVYDQSGYQTRQLPVVTHHEWSSLPQAQRLKRIQQRLSERPSGIG